MTTNDFATDTRRPSFRERFEKQREKYRSKRGGLIPIRFTGSYHDLCRILNKRSYVRSILRPRGFAPTTAEQTIWSHDRPFEIESLLSFDGTELNEWLCIFHEYWLTLKQLIDRNIEHEQPTTTRTTDEQHDYTERGKIRDVVDIDSSERKETCTTEENDVESNESVPRSTTTHFPENDDRRHDSAIMETCLRVFEEDEGRDTDTENESTVTNMVMIRLDAYRRKRCIWHVAT